MAMSPPPSPPPPPQEAAQRVNGTVVWYNPVKGFGFIQPDSYAGVSSDIYVHRSSIGSSSSVGGLPSLAEGDNVRFSVVRRDDSSPVEGKFFAVDVTVLPRRRRGMFLGDDVKSCFNCGGTGHSAEDCSKGSAYDGDVSLIPGGNGVGFGFGEVEHAGVARDSGITGESGRNANGVHRSVVGNGGHNKSCFNCGVNGHVMRDCPLGRTPRITGITDGGGNGSFYSGPCFNCGERGHKAHDCQTGSGSSIARDKNGGGGSLGVGGQDSNSCFSCGGKGHMARDCQVGGADSNRSQYDIGVGRDQCYNCGERGHMARDCHGSRHFDKNGCYNCGEKGHLARFCKRNRESNSYGSSNNSGKGCFSCGGYGHVARDCVKRESSSGNLKCYSCGGYGHKAMDCVRRGGIDGSFSTLGEGKCFSCGEAGHFARECTKLS